MSKGKELAKNTIILFIGVFFTKIIQYFLLPVYTGYLTTEEYGTVDLFNTIISLLIPIIGLQIEQVIEKIEIDKRSIFHLHLSLLFYRVYSLQLFVLFLISLLIMNIK